MGNIINNHGGKRKGAGNKPVQNPLPVKTIRCTSKELDKLKLYLQQLRK